MENCLGIQMYNNFLTGICARQLNPIIQPVKIAGLPIKCLKEFAVFIFLMLFIKPF
jgi:hypothetical protein